jgi:hypothetical protein
MTTFPSKSLTVKVIGPDSRGRGQFRYELGDSFVGGSRLVGFHARGTFDDTGVDECMTFTAERGCLADTGLCRYGSHRFTHRSRAAICRPADDGY